MSNSDQPSVLRLRYICVIERAADEESALMLTLKVGYTWYDRLPRVHVTGRRQGTREFTSIAQYARDVTNDSNETGEPDGNQTTACKKELEWIMSGDRLTKEETWEIIVRKGLKRSLLR